MFELKYNLNSSLSFDDASGEHNVVVVDVVVEDDDDDAAAAAAAAAVVDDADIEDADDDADDDEFLLRKWPTISKEPFCSSGTILALVTWRWVPANSSMRQRLGCHQQGVMVQYDEEAVRAHPSSG